MPREGVFFVSFAAAAHEIAVRLKSAIRRALANEPCVFANKYLAYRGNSVLVAQHSPMPQHR